jgi:hypothetical protein
MTKCQELVNYINTFGFQKDIPVFTISSNVDLPRIVKQALKSSESKLIECEIYSVSSRGKYKLSFPISSEVKYIFARIITYYIVEQKLNTTIQIVSKNYNFVESIIYGLIDVSVTNNIASAFPSNMESFQKEYLQSMKDETQEIFEMKSNRDLIVFLTGNTSPIKIIQSFTEIDKTKFNITMTIKSVSDECKFYDISNILILILKYHIINN